MSLVLNEANSITANMQESTVFDEIVLAIGADVLVVHHKLEDYAGFQKVFCQYFKTVGSGEWLAFYCNTDLSKTSITCCHS